MGIAGVKPGQYETACGKGYWECGKDEPEKLSTKRDAVEFFKDESASSVYVYNPRKTEIHFSRYQRLKQFSSFSAVEISAVETRSFHVLTAGH
jgi:hypothetical protein